MSREQDLERRVGHLERLTSRQDREMEQLRRELRALGVQVPELNPTGRTKLSPEARLTRMHASAARARSAKQLGKGKGAVSDPGTAARLRAEAQDLLAEADELDVEDDGGSHE